MQKIANGIAENAKIDSYNTGNAKIDHIEGYFHA